MLSISPDVLSGGILLCVLIAVVARPWRLSAAWPATLGALLTLALGLLSWSALAQVFATIWDAAATLVALFILSDVLESNGFFRWAALHLARLAGGSGWRLYLLTLLLTAGVTAFLANDGAVLMLTPILAALLAGIFPNRRDHLPYLFALGFLADGLSILLIPSNLTNIIVADASHLEVVSSARWMALPALATLLAVGAAYAVRYRTRLCARYDVAALEAPTTAIGDMTLFRIGWGALIALVIGYILSEPLHLPIAVPAGTVALVMLLITHLRRRRSAITTLRAAPWGILLYALGMFVVIAAAFKSGALAPLVAPLQAQAQGGLRGATVSAGLVAGLSAATNNLPTTLVSVLALQSTPHVSQIARYAILIGVDIGPKLTPFGSLATLLWLDTLKRNGVIITWGHYLRENWWVTLIALAAALGGLALASLLFA